MRFGFLEVSDKDMLNIKEWSRKRLYYFGVLIGIILGIDLAFLLFYYFGDVITNILNTGVF